VSIGGVTPAALFNFRAGGSSVSAHLRVTMLPVMGIACEKIFLRASSGAVGAKAWPQPSLGIALTSGGSTCPFFGPKDRIEEAAHIGLIHRSGLPIEAFSGLCLRG
jgi:hypothetical protein